MNMRKPPSRKTLKAKLDKVFSLVIRSRGGCQRCGSNHYVQCAHVYTRTYLSTRWFAENAFAMCAACHWWGHLNPVDFAEWVKEMHGEKKLARLKLMAHTPRKWSIQEMQDLHTELKEQLCTSY